MQYFCPQGNIIPRSWRREEDKILWSVTQGSSGGQKRFVLRQDVSVGFAGWEEVGKQSGRKIVLVYSIY